ncbi:MAG: hypothetical protein HY841_07580 [Bacteroidetes bacterium]|nr:hypothetical protein [Bacteroidota bacterium]
MKKIYFISALLLSAIFFFPPQWGGSGWGFSQNIAINTTGAAAANCAILDVSSGTLGLLIPRLNLTVTTTYLPLTGAAVEGLIVYNTNTPTAITGTGAAGAGYYYWSVTAARWVNLIDNVAPGSAWMLNGNTLGAAGSFLGSIDAYDLVFRTTNTDRMTILAAGNVGINVAPSASYQLLVSSTLATAGNATIYGASTGAANVYGVLGSSSSATGMGVYGFNTAAAGTGVLGSGNNIAGSYLAGGSGGAFASTNVGVYGYGNNTNLSYGVYGVSANANGVGMVGVNTVASGAGTGDGVYGSTIQSGGMGGFFTNTNTSGTGLIIAGNNAGATYLVSGSGGSFIATTKGLISEQSTANASALGTLYGNGADYEGIYSRANVQSDGGWGYYWHFGVHGELVSTSASGTANSERCGGVLGSYVQGGLGQCAGALGYHRYADNGYYGGWFTTSLTNAASKMSYQDTSLRVGIGSFSSYLGANIQGGKYGIYSEGADFALYSHGNEYKDGLDVHLQNVGNENKAMFTMVSNNVSIQANGVGTLMNGESEIVLDKNFMQVASTKVPMSINVTPMGECNGLYVQKTENGFIVKELNGGKSSIEFSYIVIANRTGYENPAIANNYDDLLNKLKGDKGEEARMSEFDNTVHNAATMTRSTASKKDIKILETPKDK